MLGLVADDIDHVVDGDAAHQFAVGFHHRRGDQVEILESLGDLGGRQVHRYAVDIGIHHLGNIAFRIERDQLGQTEHAQIAAIARHHEQRLGVLRQRGPLTQIASDHVQRHVRAHRDGVVVHEPAGGIRRVGHDRFQPVAVLHVHRAQHFARDLFRQVFDEVGEVVDLQTFGGGQQDVVIESLDQLGPDLVVDV